MAIPFTKYIDITSGVGGATIVANRELIGRLFTINPLLPSSSVVEFNSAAEVLAYFGSTSEEYKRALFYFSWISKLNTSPAKISFARWVDTDQAPMIFGAPLTATLTALKLITNGSFSLTLGATTNVMSGLDFSGAANLAAIAAIIQAAIRTKTGTQWTAAAISYNAVRGSFDFVGGSAAIAAITVASGGLGTNISVTMGWQSANAILSDGMLTQTITQVLDSSSELSNNFGSFLFLPTLSSDEVVEAAAWNNGQNLFYQFIVPVPDAMTATSYCDPTTGLLIGYAGVGVTLSLTAGEYPEQCPMMILAATNYNTRNSTQNYMFQIFNLTPSVNTAADSTFYDALGVNYYGQTQTAGQLLQFYQRGTLQGLPVSPRDMNVYANEQWLKDAAGTALMALQLALTKISANTQGRAQILTTLRSTVGLALTNRVISVGGELDNTQKLYIGQVTGDLLAWYQVQNIGYWLDCTIVAVVVNTRTEYQARYTLVYKKDDTIRKILGIHTLI